MESRLERVLNDNQRQLSVLQKELSTEKDLRAEVETKFRDAIEACSSREKEVGNLRLKNVFLKKVLLPQTSPIAFPLDACFAPKCV